MALCSEPADVSSAVHGELKKERKVAVITGITGQVRPEPASSIYTVAQKHLNASVVVIYVNGKCLFKLPLVFTHVLCASKHQSVSVTSLFALKLYFYDFWLWCMKCADPVC